MSNLTYNNNDIIDNLYANLGGIYIIFIMAQVSNLHKDQGVILNFFYNGRGG